MNLTKIIHITNKVALFSVGLLIYWVFVFICISVFGFKVFKENVTEGFYFSIAGILAILAGAIILNIMLNLTKISEHVQSKQNKEDPDSFKRGRIKFILFIISFPLIFSFLYLGDMASSRKKESYLVDSCKQLINENKKVINELSSYQFNKNYIRNSGNILKLLSKIDENFPRVYLIAEDSIKGKKVYLRFTENNHLPKDQEPEKISYIYSTSKEERTYLKSVFEQNNNDHLFSASDGNYEIYYPIVLKQQTLLLYLSDFQRYGKLGS